MQSFRCVDIYYTSEPIIEKVAASQVARNKVATPAPVTDGGGSATSGNPVSSGTVTSPAPTPASYWRQRQAEWTQAIGFGLPKEVCRSAKREAGCHTAKQRLTTKSNLHGPLTLVFWRKFRRLLGTWSYRWRSIHLGTREISSMAMVYNLFKPRWNLFVYASMLKQATLSETGKGPFRCIGLLRR